MATREDEPDLKIGTTFEVRHSLGTDEVDINDSNNRPSGRARLSDNCLKIMDDKPWGRLDLPLFVFLMARLTESGVKERFVIFTQFCAVRSKLKSNNRSGYHTEERLPET